jgi:hypothetical protein
MTCVDRVKLIWISTKESGFAGCKLRFLVVFCFADFVLGSQVSSSERGGLFLRSSQGSFLIRSLSVRPVFSCSSVGPHGLKSLLTSSIFGCQIFLPA